MKIVHLTTEFAPIAKAGGLGDVLVGLAREQTRLGHKVEVILPKYDILPKDLFSKKDVTSFLCMEKGVSYSNTMWRVWVEGCELLLLDPSHPKGYFHRGEIYGCSDDIGRFLYFCKAACEYLFFRGGEWDVLHLHDWPTALAAILARDMFRLPVKKIALTIHNAEYQGLCAPWDLDALGLSGKEYLVPDKMQDNHPKHPHLINLLKGGIVYADVVNTVSPSYAKEVLTPEIGLGLSETFFQYRHKLRGILNGVDPILWNPKTDPALAVHYQHQDGALRILEAKEAAKKSLSARFGIEMGHQPWMGSVSRLVPQKGPELMEQALRLAIEKGASFLLLGSSPIASLQRHFNELKKEFASCKNVFLHFEYDETIAHQVYAALDFLLMPSRFEPCGLSQLIAMRYGTIPIVRATGGLKDTVIDEACAAEPLEKRNGIVFEKSTKEDLSRAVVRALDLYRKDRSRFQSLVQSAMRSHFDWSASAKLYIDMYQ